MATYHHHETENGDANQSAAHELHVELSQSLRDTISKCGQSHLLVHWDRLKKTGTPQEIDKLTTHLEVQSLCLSKKRPPPL